MSRCCDLPDPTPEQYKKAIDTARALGATTNDQIADAAAALLMIPHSLNHPSPLMEAVRRMRT